MNYNLVLKILMIPGILAGFTFHEYAHAKTADILGDKTPKFQGRLTLNPIAHIDPIGFIMIILFGFGWAKPVQTNPNAFKNYYKDDLKVALAGPLANLILGLIFGIIYSLLNKFVVLNSVMFSKNQLLIFQIIISMLSMGVYMNCMLFLFNLIPIPGLDGSHIIRDLFPAFFYRISEKIYSYQAASIVIIIIFIAPIFAGNSIAGFIINGPTNFLYNIFINII